MIELERCIIILYILSVFDDYQDTRQAIGNSVMDQVT